MTKKFVWGGLLVLLAIAAATLHWIEVPYSVRGKGIIKPLQEWGLYKTSDGTLVNKLEDHRSGSLKTYSVHEFQRGDVVGFRFNEQLMQRTTVQKEDTIAWVVSYDLNMRLVEKKGELVYQQSLLDVYLSGEKPEVIQRAREEVELARRELNTQKRITDRIRSLYEEDVVPEQEYELAVNDLDVRRHTLDIAIANYEARIAGEKEEEIGAVRSRIGALEQQVEELRNHMHAMNIVSPISGEIVRQRTMPGNDQDEVIRVADVTSFLVFLPVDVIEKDFIAPGQRVVIRNTFRGLDLYGHVVEVDNSVQFINRRPKLFVSIMVENTPGTGLMSNMIVDARIETEPVRLSRYVLRKSRAVYQN